MILDLNLFFDPKTFQIAKELDLPEPYLGKILQQLTKNNTACP